MNHVYRIVTSETDHFVAESKEEATRMHRGLYGRVEQILFARQEPDGRTLSMATDRLDDDGNHVIDEKTFGEWADGAPKGLLCSTRFIEGGEAT